MVAAEARRSPALLTVPDLAESYVKDARLEVPGGRRWNLRCLQPVQRAGVGCGVGPQQLQVRGGRVRPLPLEATDGRRPELVPRQPWFARYSVWPHAPAVEDPAAWTAPPAADPTKAAFWTTRVDEFEVAELFEFL